MDPAGDTRGDRGADGRDERLEESLDALGRLYGKIQESPAVREPVER